MTLLKGAFYISVFMAAWQSFHCQVAYLAVPIISTAAVIAFVDWATR